MSTPPQIHLINPMLQVSGAEMHTVNLYRTLSPHSSVTLWGHRRAPVAIDKMVPLRRIDLISFRFPREGVFVIAGAYFDWMLRPWYFMARPRRTILLYNLHEPQNLARTMELVSRKGRRPVELVYASKALRDEVGLPGFVEGSRIHLDAFTAPARKKRGPHPFVVGRVSRDVDFKFAQTDPDMFKALARAGCQVRLVGATCLRPMLGSIPNIELWPEIPQDQIAAFLRGLDCFVYRTSDRFREAYGRVIAEAMACGVPAIVESRVGASCHIEHGVNGFIANTDDEIMSAVAALRSDPVLHARLSEAARATILRSYGPEYCQALVKFYVHAAQPEATAA